jgi:hypothetical protein
VGRLNGTLLHRLARVEQLLPVARFDPPVDPVEQFWWPLFQIAPPAVWDYLLAVDDLESHPAVEDALHALQQRIEHPHRLAHVQGEILKWSHWRYGCHLARERQQAGITQAVVYDPYVQELAAQALLGWTHRESTAAWPYPERFAAQWQNVGLDRNLDSDVLAVAGLHAAELDLLDQEEEQ